MVVQVRRGGKTVRVPGAGGMVRQHIRLGIRHDSPSDARIAQFSESFKNYMIDMRTMMMTLNYSFIKENCTPSLMIFLRASDMDTLMILEEEYEELEKEREAYAQKNKFFKTKSASQSQVTCRRCEKTGTQETR